jgi:hypothetical protein
MIRNTASPAAALLALLVTAGSAAALGPHERDGWVAGMGFGLANAKLENVEGVASDWEQGVSPQIRFGRMIGRRFMVSFETKTWMDEQGAFYDEAGEPALAIRVGLQNFNLLATWFPGAPESPAGGIFLYAGGGAAIARLTLFEPNAGGGDTGESEHQEVYNDDWGYGVTAGAGYELRIFKHLAAGASVSMNWQFMEGEGFFDQNRFVPLTMNLNWYF